MDLRPAAARLTDLLPHVDDDALDAPTPCENFRLRDLIGHIEGLAIAFHASAGKDFGPLTDTSPADSVPVLNPGWRDRLPTQLDDLASAWLQESAWQGMTRAGSVDLPGELAGIVALNEITLHGWDLAVTVGKSYDCDDATAAACLAVVTQFSDNGKGREGLFGQSVAQSEDASPFDRLLGMSGRDPGWQRP